MAKTIRLRTAPHLISLGAGVSYGSGAFYGQTAYNLTSTLQDMQAAEAMHKLANGDPETFLAFWKSNQKHYSGTLRAQLESYAADATKKVKTVGEDSAALTAYARSNNHQRYLDYLLGRLATETDQSTISKIESQVETLRGRVFASSGAGTGLGDGYTVQDLKDARDEYSQAKSAADDQLRYGPLTPAILTRLQKAGSTLDDIIQAAYESNKGTLKKSALIPEGEAARAAYGKYQDLSDAAATKASGSKTGFSLDLQGQSSFEASIASKSNAEQIKAWSDRISELNNAASSLHSAKVLTVVTDILHKSEGKADSAYKTSATPSDKVSVSQKAAQDEAYGKYQAWAIGAKEAGDITHIATQEEFRNVVLFGNPEKDLGIKISDSTKKAYEGYRPATWDYTKAAFTGDPEAVAAANAAVESVRARSSVPGSPMYGVSGTDGELYDVATGSISPSHLAQGRWHDESARDARRAAVATPTDVNQQKGGTGGTQVTPVEGASTAPPATPPADETAAATGGPKPGALSLATLTPDNVNDHIQQFGDDANAYLTESSFPDLPNWKPSPDEEKAAPDWNTMFPFSTSDTAAPASAGGGMTRSQ